MTLSDFWRTFQGHDSTSDNSINSKACIIYPVVPFPVTLSDPYPRFQGHGVIFRPIDALNVLCAQLTRDLFAIAKFLFERVVL